MRAQLISALDAPAIAAAPISSNHAGTVASPFPAASAAPTPPPVSLVAGLRRSASASGVAVDASVGVSVARGADVAVEVGSRIGVAVDVGSSVGVDVGIGVAVDVGIAVAVAVDVGSDVGVADASGFDVGVSVASDAIATAGTGVFIPAIG